MKLKSAVVFVLFALTLVSCRHHQGAPSYSRPKINPELLNLTKEQAFTKAEANFEKRKWLKARTFYAYIYETYPNDPLGRRSLLRVADTYFNQGDPVNLVEAQYKYRDFINRYPGSEQADYAMLQIANVSFKQMEHPDRDQTKTREAITKYHELFTAYPNTKYRDDAEKKMQEAMDRLADHEHIVARFYMKRANWEAAVARLNTIVDQYPNYNERDATFYDLGESLEALGRKGEARLYFERVLAEFPKSEYAGKAKQRLEGLSS